MKFNKWTVALAAAGVVSLASAAKAEEKTSSVTTALASTTLSGYVDTSAQWNFGTGDANVAPYRFNSPSKADGFNLDVIQLRIEKPLDESQWAAGYRVDLWAGPDANSLGTQSINSSGSSDFGIRQAYVALRAPVGNGLDLKMGVFDSIIGYESIESGNNPNYTRSYGNSIEPTTHTGLLATYRFSDLVSATAGVANTWNPVINDRAFAPVTTVNSQAESYKTWMGSIALTAPETMGVLAGSTLYGGVVNGFAASGNGGANVTSWYAGATVATPVTGLRVGSAFDYLEVHDSPAYAWALSGYVSYQATEKLSFHGRAEYYTDNSGVVGGPGVLFTSYPAGYDSLNVMGITATAQYDLWKNVISRLELRWDHSLQDVNIFGGTTTGGAPTLDNAWMLAANIIYKF
jgi:hypothetical protein